MFFLGHMSWAYVFAVAFAGKRGGKLFIPAILMLGVLPDVDLFLEGFGVGHHTFFHSVFFLGCIVCACFTDFSLEGCSLSCCCVAAFCFWRFLGGRSDVVLAC